MILAHGNLDEPSHTESVGNIVMRQAGNIAQLGNTRGEIYVMIHFIFTILSFLHPPVASWQVLYNIHWILVDTNRIAEVAMERILLGVLLLFAVVSGCDLLSPEEEARF